MAIGQSVLAGLSFAVIAPVLLSQHPQNQGGDVLTLRQTKQTVIVDVVVGDRYGAAVTGLKQEDFTILEDGKPQPITFFEVHGGAPMRTGALPKLPEGMYSNFPVPTASDAINVVLLDSLNTPVTDQAMVRKEMISYLKAIPVGTKIAIFTLGAHLRMVSGFSTDPQVLLQALSDKRVGMELSSILITPEAKQNEERRQDQLLSTSNMADWKSSASAEQIQSILGGIDQMRQFVSDTGSFDDDYRVKETLAAMDELGRYLKQFPGRKNVIWFSASFPIGVDPDFNQTDAYRMMRDYSMDIRATTLRLAEARVAVYPIDARRFFQNPNFQASNGGGSLMRNGYYRGESTDLEFDTVTKEHDTMDQIAKDTGGKAVYNTNDLKGAMGDVIKNGDHYYTLSYDPTGVKQDGRFHKIEVKCNQAGYSLLYRHGYVAEDASASGKAKQPGKQESTHAASLFRAEMEPGAPPASELLFRVQVAAEEKQPGAGDAPKGDNAKVAKPVTRYAFGYAVGVGQAKLVQTEDQIRHGMLLSMVIAYDKQGRPLNSVLNTQTLSLDPKVYADSLKTGLPFYQELDIPQQAVTIRVGVYDVGSGAMGAMEFPLSVKQVTAK